MNIYLNKFYQTRETIFNTIHETSTIYKVLMALIMASFTGLMAQVIIPLPWTPVPITGQTFAVLIAGLFLGKRYGVLSQIFYILIGVTFIPWFSGMTGGIEVVLGATGGYFIGFLLAAYFIGSISEKYADSHNFKKMTLVTLIANFGLIYTPGLSVLALWSYLTQGIILGPVELIIMGLAPFIIGDIVKVLAVAGTSKVFLPKE